MGTFQGDDLLFGLFIAVSEVVVDRHSETVGVLAIFVVVWHSVRLDWIAGFPALRTLMPVRSLIASGDDGRDFTARRHTKIRKRHWRGAGTTSFVEFWASIH